MERPLYWNISDVWVMYVMLAAALAVFARGVWRRLEFARLGNGGPGTVGAVGRRLLAAAREVLLQRRVMRERLPGLFHGLIFYSFLWLLLTTTVVAIDADLGLPIFRGWTYLVLSAGADVGGVLLLVGLAVAAWRRFVRRPASLTADLASAGPLVLLASLCVTGFLVEGLRIRFTGEAHPAFSPVGALVAQAFAGLSEPTGRAVHRALWWLHMGTALGLVAAIPWTRLFHVLSMPINAFLKEPGPAPALPRTDLDALMSDPAFDAASFTVGTATAKGLSWGQRFDLDSCVECGRCEDRCPSHRAGDPFGPKDFILRLRDHARRSALLAQPPAIVEDAFDEKYVWHCRTCRACVEACPAAIDHVTPMIEIRRDEVLMKGRLPDEAQAVLRTMEGQGTAFGSNEQRVDFLTSAGFPVVPPGGEVEVLYFVGCLTSFDPAKQRIARDLARLLDLAGVRWGTLGGEETCCGDPARALGNELVFQTVAKAQLAAIRARTFTHLVVNCPHCLHVLGTEYRSLGAELPVIHHSQLLARLIADGRLEPSLEQRGDVAFHDPCYLGRYQGEVEAPREVLRALPGLRLEELPERREASMCCGAGGGHFWMDLKAPERINNLRLAQATAAGASCVGTACPYCMSMFTDSVSGLELEGKMEIADVATLTLRAIEATGRPAAPSPSPSGAALRP